MIEEEIKKPMLYQKAQTKPKLEMIDSESDSDNDDKDGKNDDVKSNGRKQ